MKNYHLPAAVDYEDRQDLDRLDSSSLRKLLDECTRWFLGMEDFRAALSTLPGRTEWEVLTRQETACVAAAHERLQDEVREREAALCDLISNPETGTRTES